MGRPPSETDGSTDRPQTRGDRGYRLTGTATDDDHAAKRQEADRPESWVLRGDGCSAMLGINGVRGDEAMERLVSSTAEEGAACAHQQTEAEQQRL